MRLHRLLPCLFLALAMCPACAPRAQDAGVRAAPDPVALFGQHFSVVAQSRDARIVRLRLGPGAQVGAHGHHPTTFWYALTAGAVAWSEPGKQSQPIDVQAGGAALLPKAPEHTLRNVGADPVELLLFEVSDRADPQPKRSGVDAVTAAPQVYELLVEGGRARLLRASLGPNRADPVHSHPSSVVYALTGGTVRTHGDAGLYKELEFEAGFTLLQPEARAHRMENLGESEVRLLQLELF